MKNRIAFFAIAGMVSATAFSATAESHSATAANAMGLDVTFANQIELKAFEAQTGAAMAFTGTPLFADRVTSGDLAAVGDRLPTEPLVILPFEQIGTSGGTLRGVANAL